jgi:peptidoglycan hydrolase-like protein with peptidoglycan-binding domain
MRWSKPTSRALKLLLAASLGVSALLVCSENSRASTKKTVSSKGSSGIHKSRNSKGSRRRERGQKAPTPERISEIQQALAKDGSFTGAPDGRWDASTIAAIRSFQEAHGLYASGKLDAKTLHLLGLGSPIAGVAPPLPPVSSAAVNSTAQTSRRQK